jgi:hypothetical protein
MLPRALGMINETRPYKRAGMMYVTGKRAVIERDSGIGAGLADWLYQHFARLTVDQRKHLARLRDEYRKFPHADQRAEYGPTWEMDSRAIRSLRPFCQVCGSKSEHVHHRHYKASQPGPVHVVALCAMCHYFIHPRTNMTGEAFKKYRQGL